MSMIYYMQQTVAYTRMYISELIPPVYFIRWMQFPSVLYPAT
jgi:hypothetical protein